MYEGIEMILKVQAVAATSISVESYVESLVSTYEHHFYKKWNPGEDTINCEFNIMVNGPVVNHSERIIKRALDRYFGGSLSGISSKVISSKKIPRQQSSTRET